MCVRDKIPYRTQKFHHYPLKFFFFKSKQKLKKFMLIFFTNSEEIFGIVIMQNK